MAKCDFKVVILPVNEYDLGLYDRITYTADKTMAFIWIKKKHVESS